MFKNGTLERNKIYKIYRYMLVLRGLITNYVSTFSSNLSLTFPFRSSTNTAEADIVFPKCVQHSTFQMRTKFNDLLESSLAWIQFNFIQINTFFDRGRPYIPPCRFPEGFLTSPHAGETFTWVERGWKRLFRHRCPLESATLQVMTNARFLFIFTIGFLVSLIRIPFNW